MIGTTPLRASGIAAFITYCLLASPATAQTASAPSPALPAQPETTLQPCVVADVPTADGSSKMLYAGCGDQHFVLGPADTFEVEQNAALNATVVDITRAGERRVLMLSYQNDKPLLEDITGTLARSAGRGTMRGIAGLDIGLGTFAQDGAVAVRPNASDGVRLDRAASVNLGTQIAAEQALVGAAAVQQPATPATSQDGGEQQ